MILRSHQHGDAYASNFAVLGPIVAGYGNAWGKALNLTEINQLTCDSEGDLISFSNFTVKNNSMGSNMTCPCDTFENTPSECHGNV